MIKKWTSIQFYFIRLLGPLSCCPKSVIFDKGKMVPRNVKCVEIFQLSVACFCCTLDFYKYHSVDHTTIKSPICGYVCNERNVMRPWFYYQISPFDLFLLKIQLKKVKLESCVSVQKAKCNLKITGCILRKKRRNS